MIDALNLLERETAIAVSPRYPATRRRAYVIEGPAAIGKTRLVEAATETGAARATCSC